MFCWGLGDFNYEGHYDGGLQQCHKHLFPVVGWWFEVSFSPASALPLLATHPYPLVLHLSGNQSLLLIAQHSIHARRYLQISWTGRGSWDRPATSPPWKLGIHILTPNMQIDSDASHVVEHGLGFVDIHLSITILYSFYRVRTLDMPAWDCSSLGLALISCLIHSNSFFLFFFSFPIVVCVLVCYVSRSQQPMNSRVIRHRVLRPMWVISSAETDRWLLRLVHLLCTLSHRNLIRSQPMDRDHTWSDLDTPAEEPNWITR